MNEMPLNAKIGILRKMENSSAPLSSDDIDALVNNEENFLHFRSALAQAIDVLNQFISQSAASGKISLNITRDVLCFV